MSVSPRFISPRTGLAILIALLIGAFGLPLWDQNEPSIWHDEGWSIRAIRDPIGTPDDKTPLAYYSLVHFLWLGAGETPLALRYGSVLLGLLTVTSEHSLCAAGPTGTRRSGGCSAEPISAALGVFP
jgi:hypothetical protein